MPQSSHPENRLGTFYGVGVGPGPVGLIPVSALRALHDCEIIYCPIADSREDSKARWCLRGLDIPQEKFRNIPFKMDPNRNVLRNHYNQFSHRIARELIQGKNVGYLTLGDPLTYSTYGYTISALLEVLPEVPHHTFPGITSFAAIAAFLNWPLGEGKERLLILPCPDNMKNLQVDIESHDVVVLMKIGKRLPRVLRLLQSMNIERYCAFGGYVGFEEEVLCNDLTQLKAGESTGYLSTMLIRKLPREKRHV